MSIRTWGRKVHILDREYVTEGDSVDNCALCGELIEPGLIRATIITKGAVEQAHNGCAIAKEDHKPPRVPDEAERLMTGIAIVAAIAIAVARYVLVRVITGYMDMLQHLSPAPEQATRHPAHAATTAATVIMMGAASVVAITVVVWAWWTATRPASGRVAIVRRAAFVVLAGMVLGYAGATLAGPAGGIGGGLAAVCAGAAAFHPTHRTDGAVRHTRMIDQTPE